MARIVVTMERFPAALQRSLQDRRRLVAKVVALEICHRALNWAVRLVNAERIVDTGFYKKSFFVRSTRNGAELVNTAPYAGVIEHGRRPRATMPPLDAIVEWVRRKLRFTGGKRPRKFREQEAIALAELIRWKIYHRGIPPKHIFRRTHKQIKGWWPAAVRRALKQE
jgi:hypothetical protein